MKYFIFNFDILIRGIFFEWCWNVWIKWDEFFVIWRIFFFYNDIIGFSFVIVFGFYIIFVIDNYGINNGGL